MARVFTRRQLLGGMVATAAIPLQVQNTRASGAQLHDVAIRAFAFEPAVLRVRLGDVIRWTNHDLAPHTATANEFGWETGELSSGQSAEITVTADMEVSYFCAFHPHMKAMIEVVN
jgi:plastocyanin